ncbi:MAG: TadE family type IV pilus minor pilin [Micropruina sp.]|uniref:TadE family type IV pilus minor pilin n=1 Tax=Micropruina sp. TaxID=2737536 RepID=UPI0039E4E469
MRSERGMVSVEVAFGVLLSAVVTLGLCYLIAIVIQLGQLQAVAGEVARQEARGDTAAARRAEHDAPDGTRVRVSGSGADVVVEAELQSRPWGGVIPPVGLSARAVVAREEG